MGRAQVDRVRVWAGLAALGNRQLRSYASCVCGHNIAGRVAPDTEEGKGD